MKNMFGKKFFHIISISLPKNGLDLPDDGNQSGKQFPIVLIFGLSCAFTYVDDMISLKNRPTGPRILWGA